MSIRDRLTWYYHNFGLQGILAVSRYHLLGTPNEMSVRPPDIRYPVHLRLRSSDLYAYSEVMLVGEYDFDLPFAPRTIIDVGANVGMASIFFAHKYPEARIIAIEAEALNFAVLAKNVQPYPQITAIHAALWNQDGEISVSKRDPNRESYGEWAFFTHEGPGCCVRAITMRTLMKEMQISYIDLLKMDIEGAEKEVFEACDWADAVCCLMIETHDRLKPGCSAAVNSVCTQFSPQQRGYTTLYLRNSSLNGPMVH